MLTHTRSQDRPIAIPYNPQIQANNTWIHTYIASQNFQKTSNQNTKILQWKAKDQRNVALTCRRQTRVQKMKARTWKWWLRAVGFVSPWALTFSDALGKKLGWRNGFTPPLFKILHQTCSPRRANPHFFFFFCKTPLQLFVG